MKKTKIPWLVLTLFLLLILPQLVRAEWSEHALLQRKVFDPDVWRLTKGYANSEWGVDLFAYPYSASQAYFLVDTTLLSAVTFITDYAFHRVIYIECYSDWIRAYGSFGSELGQFNSPSGVVVYNRPNDDIYYYYVYVADTWNNRIVGFKYFWPNEEIYALSEITGDGLVRPVDLDINNGGDFGDLSNDHLWVANGDGTIKKFNLYGSLILTRDVGGLEGIACGRSFFTDPSPPYEEFANNNYVYIIAGIELSQFLEEPPGNLQAVRFAQLPTRLGWKVSRTSLDVDNFGHVWVTVVEEEVATGNRESYIKKSTHDLELLCQFNAGGIFNGLKNFSNTGGYRGCGNVFVLEEWDDESGGLYYVIGTDILDYYIGSNEEHWCHFADYTLVDPALILVKVYNEGKTLVKTVKDTINPHSPDLSGRHQQYWWDGTDDSNHIVPSGNYRIEVTAYSVYGNINTQEHVNTVSKDGWVYHIDYSEPLNTPGITSVVAIDTCLNLEWNDNNNNELGYVIERKSATDPQWMVIDTSTWDVESYTDYQIVGSETYSYRIKAYNYFGSTGYSNEVTDKALPWPPVFIHVENWYCNRRFHPIKLTCSGKDSGQHNLSGNDPDSLERVFAGKSGVPDCPSPYPDSVLSDVSALYGEVPANQKPGTYAGVVIMMRRCSWYNHFDTTYADEVFVDPFRMVIYTKPDTVYCTDWRYWFEIATVDIYGDTSTYTPGEWAVDYSCCVGDCHLHLGGYPDPSKTVPAHFCLDQNYPNPFNPQTQITYALPEESVVRLAVYNLLGQRVRVLVDGLETPGFKRVRWDGKDDEGSDVASGVYFYRLHVGEYSQVRKMLMLK